MCRFGTVESAVSVCVHVLRADADAEACAKHTGRKPGTVVSFGAQVDAISIIHLAVDLPERVATRTWQLLMSLSPIPLTCTFLVLFLLDPCGLSLVIPLCLTYIMGPRPTWS